MPYPKSIKLPSHKPTRPKHIKHGVFLARMQPLHNGHLYMIRQAMEQCDHLLIVLGSSNKESMTRNPFTLETRHSWLVKSLHDNPKFLEHSDIIQLPDWSFENDINETEEWGRYLYYNIVAHIQSKKFSIFYNDDINIIKSWFPSPLDKRVDIRWQPRSEIFNGLSATKIREAIINDDQDYLTQYLPQPVLDDVPYIKRYLIKIKNHPLPDFSME